MQRAMIVRALVAAALIGGMLALAIASGAHAEPVGCMSDNNGRRLCGGATSVERVAHGTGRPAGCPRAWCGCWARLQEGLPKEYNRALHWLNLRHVGPQIGAWAVMRRRGGGHVGRVTAFDASGNPVLISGNHNGRVATATYPRGRIIAYVMP